MEIEISNLKEIEESTIRSYELFDKLFNNSTVPVVQRNYCWEERNIKNFVGKLLRSFNKDPNSIHPTGMISLFMNKDGQYQILDGQQRITTLRLLLRALGNNTKVKFNVERDNGVLNSEENIGTIVRTNFMDSTTVYKSGGEYFSSGYTNYTSDHQTIADSTKTLHNMLYSEEIVAPQDLEAFGNFIYKNLEFMITIVYSEPTSEFLGMNTKKMPFRRYDTMKSCCLIPSSLEERENISRVFVELSKQSFNKESLEILRLVCNKPDVKGINTVDCYFVGTEYEYIQIGVNVDFEIKRLTRIIKLIDEITCHSTEDISKLFRWYNKNYYKLGNSIMDIIGEDITIISINKLIYKLITICNYKLYNLSDIILGIGGTDKFEALLQPDNSSSMLPEMIIEGEELTLIKDSIINFYKVKEGTHEHREQGLNNFSF